MLVLTRREGETIFIGDNIAITVVGIKGNQVRIGIEAPRDVNVVRQELLGSEKAINDIAAARE